MLTLEYPVRMEPAEEGGFVVTFPDVPEAITEGDNEHQALLRAVDALETALEMYVDAGEDLPAARKPRRGQRTVSPGARASLALSIYQAMRAQNLRKSDLAKRLHWHLPQVDRVLDIRHASRLDQAEAALAALGQRLVLTVQDVGVRTHPLRAKEPEGAATNRKTEGRLVRYAPPTRRKSPLRVAEGRADGDGNASEGRVRKRRV
jgi:antitoxin HicB